MKEYTIYCPDEVCIEALKLGAPIEEVGQLVNGEEPAKKVTGARFAYNLKVYKRPTAEQMCGWLHGRGIYAFADWNGYHYYGTAYNMYGLLNETGKYDYYNDALVASIKLALMQLNLEK